MHAWCVSREGFDKSIHHQLHTAQGKVELYEALQLRCRLFNKYLEESYVVAQHLERALINTACIDLGARVATELVLPLLQERLEEAARQYIEDKARQAQEEIIVLFEVRYKYHQRIDVHGD
jgi:hypothetical protein